jgi:ribosomal RNA-processing protein 8
MFEVEGWKLGPLARQSVPLKTSKKRKREEKDNPNTISLEKVKRGNPFSLSGQGAKTFPTTGNRSTRSVKHEPVHETVKTQQDGLTQGHMTKVKKHRKRKPKKTKTYPETTNHSQPVTAPIAASASLPSPAPPLPQLTPLQQKMRAKLTGSQFRQINEKLYTTPSTAALSLFTSQPALFHSVCPPGRTPS